MRTLFVGTGAIGLPSLKWLLACSQAEVVAVVTQPDKAAGRHRTLTPGPVKTFALEASLPVLQAPKIRAPESLAEIAGFTPELIVCMAYGQILPVALLNLPPRGCLNLHASLLPKYRGAAPIQAAISAGDLETGITVMWMDAGLDTGDVLLQKTEPIHADDTAGTLHDRLGLTAATALATVWPLLVSGSAPRQAQDASQASHAPKLDVATGRIVWTRTAIEIERHIRAMQPWPGASALLPPAQGAAPRLCKIQSAALVHDVSGPPGSVLAAGREGIVVACGTGAISIHRLRPEGRASMAAADFLNGHPISIGAMCPDAA